MSSATVHRSRRAAVPPHRLTWYGTGHLFLQAQVDAIEAATTHVRLETYIFSDSHAGRLFRDVLTAAARRGVHVEVLLDGFGSAGLTEDFFAPLFAAGGRQRYFNQPRLGRWALRDHRKILLIDDETAFVGGCNIADEYDGDGVGHGWRDGGVAVMGTVLVALRTEFLEQWRRAQRKQWELVRGGVARQGGSRADVLALLMKPGVGPSPLRTALREDLKHAKNISVTSAYFLPSRRLRAQIRHARQRGAHVRVLLAGKSDVKLMALASQSLYRGLLRAGVEVYEYQPQVLHAKTMVLDDIVYVGSSNLDPRSLRINFEVMLRIKNAALAAQVRAQFQTDLEHSRRVTLADTAGFRSWWPRLKQRFAFFLLGKLDPWIAREHLRRMR
jgi:cardiolipin synthase